jgi:parallel beta helix pectate lyase-like protein
MGRLGATVAGTIRVLLAANPDFQLEKRRLQMNKFRFTIQILAIATFMFAFASFAQAQATRTWVSGVGDDANPCSRTAPCKTFAGAISKTATGGEIDALDPGGFGSVTITKSIHIDGTGTLAGILSANVNAIIINALSTSTVTLRGIDIEGTGTGLSGVRVLAAKQVNIIDCIIEGMTTGIDVSMNQASVANIYVLNTVVKNCTGDAMSVSNTAAGPTKFTLERSAFLESANGLHVKSSTQGTARNCDFSHNTTNGVFTDAVTAGTVAVVRIWASQISSNAGTGVRSGNAGNAGTPLVEIAQNQIDQNAGVGVQVTAPGIVETFTNNSIKGNGTNGCTGCTSAGPGN